MFSDTTAELSEPESQDDEWSSSDSSSEESDFESTRNPRQGRPRSHSHHHSHHQEASKPGEEAGQVGGVETVGRNGVSTEGRSHLRDESLSRPRLPPRAASGGPGSERRPLSTNHHITGGSLQRMITGLAVDLVVPPKLTPPPPPAALTDATLSTIIPADPVPAVVTTSVTSIATPSPSPTSPHALNSFTLASQLNSVPFSNSLSESPLAFTPPPHHSTPSPARSSSSKSLLRKLSSSSQPRPSTLKMTVISPAVVGPVRPALSRRSTVGVPTITTVLGGGVPIRSSQSTHSLNELIASGGMSLDRRTPSMVSLEPKSYTTGFDTTVFDRRPSPGSVAPPPTPCAPLQRLGSPPPSAMKTTTIKKPTTTGKKIFFISSPNSDSDEEGSQSKDTLPRSSRDHRSSSSSSNRSRRSSALPNNTRLPFVSTSPSPASQSRPPTASTSRLSPRSRPAPLPTTEPDESWDDEEDEDEVEDDDASSGWGSEYSTESDPSHPSTAAGVGRRSAAKPERPSLFEKRPSITTVIDAQLKPRPAGLLSQLFHPSLGVEEDKRSGISRTFSNAEMKSSASRMNGGAGAGGGGPVGVRRAGLHVSKSTGVLNDVIRNKSFLRGAPEGTEMESDSEEDRDDADEEEDDEDDQVVVNIAPPQTPRTTRRAMLSTELSESLRKNLLWERQTRKKAMGVVPIAPIIVTEQQQQQQQQRLQLAPPPLTAAASSTSTTTTTSAKSHKSLSPEQHILHPPSPNLHPMVRRHTTGTGLYLAAHKSRREEGSSDSESSEDDESQMVEGVKGGGGVFESAFSHGLHSHGW